MVFFKVLLFCGVKMIMLGIERKYDMFKSFWCVLLFLFIILVLLMVNLIGKLEM